MAESGGKFQDHWEGSNANPPTCVPLAQLRRAPGLGRIMNTLWTHLPPIPPQNSPA